MSYEFVAKYEGDLDRLVRKAEPILAAANFNFAGYQASWTAQVVEIVEEFNDELADVLPGRWENALITQVTPGGYIPPHNDVPLAGTLRHHLVLADNDLSWVMSDGDWRQLEQGSIYVMDARRVHAAVNWGPVPRTHLVVDLVSGG